MTTGLDEVAEGRSTGGISLSMVPVLESGVNWVDFERRIEEYLVMSGLGVTMNPEWKPPKLTQDATEAIEAIPATNGRAVVPAVLASPASVESDLAYTSRLAITSWGEKQSRGCMAIRSRCGYNPYNAVKDLKTVYCYGWPRTQALYLDLWLRSESRRKDKEERKALRKGGLEYIYMEDPPNGA
ncbi:hypothetical protein ACEPPN_001650 [Leptodophora sp. 'Broadleaf-Isolate-01']